MKIPSMDIMSAPISRWPICSGLDHCVARFAWYTPTLVSMAAPPPLPMDCAVGGNAGSTNFSLSFTHCMLMRARSCFADSRSWRCSDSIDSARCTSGGRAAPVAPLILLLESERWCFGERGMGGSGCGEVDSGRSRPWVELEGCVASPPLRRPGLWGARLCCTFARISCCISDGSATNHDGSMSSGSA